MESGCSKFATNVGEVHVDKVAAGRAFRFPDGVEDIYAGVDSAWMTHQEFEDVEFCGTELEFFPLVSDESFGGGEFEVSEGKDVGVGGAELNGDSGEEFVEVVGLDDLVAGAKVEEFDFFLGGVAGGEDDDADTSGAFQAGEDVAAVSVWEGEVKENEVGGLFYGVGETL